MDRGDDGADPGAADEGAAWSGRDGPGGGGADPDRGPDRPGDGSQSGDDEGPPLTLGRVLRAEEGVAVFVREAVTSAVAVLAVGALLFAVSGVWPPLVAVESGSMQPHLQRGDLVFVMDEQRFAPDYATRETGVVTYQVGREHGYRSFGSYGDVIVYHPNGNPDRKPIIHRARFWVEEGENWLSEANSSYVSGSTCASVANCPAPNAGFMTKGDNPVTNDYYDQTAGLSRPVKPSWIEGTAEVSIPWLGYVRLTFAEVRAGHQAPLLGLAGAA